MDLGYKVVLEEELKQWLISQNKKLKNKVNLKYL
jgi:hypothetical protein